MQKIPLELAQAGMVLEKPLLRENGLVLVAEGTELTETLIGRLENMKITSIVVQGEPVEMEGMSGTSYAKRIERLDHLFRGHEDQWMQKVKLFLRHYFQSRAAVVASRNTETQDGVDNG
ncbi:MAG: hypothetical protein ACLFTB_03785 [Desulfovibrionales bacterium]